MKRKLRSAFLGVFLPALVVAPAWGQSAPASPAAPAGGTSGAAPSGASGSAANGAQSVPVAPPSTVVAAPAVPYGGFPSGSAASLNSHLPSSSQPSLDTSRTSDGFDLAPKSTGPGIVRGDPNASFSSGHVDAPPEMVPPVHIVQRGETLWEICDRYYHNPWDWPRVWSYNPDLQNPHWIYPGGEIKLLPPGTATAGKAESPDKKGRFVGRQITVPPTTVFLREQGYLDDEVKDVWGELGGSPDDQLLLSEGDNAYLDLKPGHDVAVGDELSIFRPQKNTLKGDAKGTVVAILGTVKVEKWDPQTRVARGRLTESLDVIERGAFVGPVGRRFQIVPPVRNSTELWAHVAASIYPHVFYGQNQMVFIDKGQKDGLVAGNRLFVVTRGDEYRKTLIGASQYAASRVHYETDKPSTFEQDGALGHGDDEKYPEEVVGEVRVLAVRDHSAACLVVSANREIEPGQRLVARAGY